MDRCKECDAVLINVYKHGLCRQCRKIEILENKIEILENKKEPPSPDEYEEDIIKQISDLKIELDTIKGIYIESSSIKSFFKTNISTLLSMMRKIRKKMS